MWPTQHSTTLISMLTMNVCQVSSVLTFIFCCNKVFVFWHPNDVHRIWFLIILIVLVSQVTPLHWLQKPPKSHVTALAQFVRTCVRCIHKRQLNIIRPCLSRPPKHRVARTWSDCKWLKYAQLWQLLNNNKWIIKRSWRNIRYYASNSSVSRPIEIEFGMDDGGVGDLTTIDKNRIKWTAICSFNINHLVHFNHSLQSQLKPIQSKWINW